MFRGRHRKMFVRRIASLLPCMIVVLMLVCVFAPTASSASAVPPDDTDYTLVDDYWPMDKTGPGAVVYASGTITFEEAGADGCSATHVTDGAANMTWGNDVDRRSVRPINPVYCVWDLGKAFSSIVAFPIQDGSGAGRLAEGLEFKIWGSNDFDIANPGAATWVAADLDTVYGKGWSNAGEGQCGGTDDYVSVWDWYSGAGSGDSYRFIKAQSVWDTPGFDDPEIDAIKGVLGASLSPEATCGWETGVVEQGRTFNYTSLKIGADGRAHIAYGGEELYYAVYDDATWHVQQVDRHGVGAYCSLALDSLGNAAISYYDSANGDLKYAYQDGTLHDVWASAANSVFAVGDNGTILHWDGSVWSPMASGTTNTLNSVWGTSATNVFAAGANGTILRWDGSAWSPMVSGTTNTLNGVWGSDGSHVFAVGASGTVRYYDGSSWVNAPGTTGSGTTSDLRGVWGSDASHVFAVGASGTVRYYDGSSWGNAPGTTGSGTTRSLADVWGSSSSNVFAVGEFGTIIRYNGSAWAAASVGVADCLNSVWGTSSSDVFAVGCSGIILHWNGTSWSSMNSSTTNALQGVGGSSAASVFAVGYEGTIIGYDGVLWTTAASGNGWLIETVDSSGDVGSHTALAFDSLGRPCISYSDATNGNLKYASWDGARWTVTTVDSTGWVGTYTSLAFNTFNSLGRPAISYYDATNGDLRLAQWDGTCWVIATVDSAVDVGSYSSLAFDASDPQAPKPAISYHDATEGRLKYAHWSGTAWNIETVDSTGWVGEYSSLTFDTSNRPGVSYYAAGEHDLKYAHWNGTAWDIEAVDSAGDVGSYTSLDFDTSGKPSVSYYDATNDALKYAAWNGTTWKIETVNGVWWVGRFSSVAFDGSNNPAIS